jgi:heat shock protein HslJ
MVALDDHRLVLLDLELVPNPNAEGPALTRAAVLDLTDRSWQRLPDSEIVGLGGPWLHSGGLLVNPATESYDGGEVGNWGRSYPAGGILDPDAGRWSALPATAPPQRQYLHVATVAGDGVVVTGNSVLHVRDRSWAALPDLPALHDVGSAATAWAGDRLFVWGGARFDEAHPGGQLRSAGWTWRPDRVRTVEAGPTDVPTATPSVEPPGTPGGDPWRLIGSWLVTADGEESGAVLRISGHDVSLWRRCGQWEGGWRADQSGLFVADFSSASEICHPEVPFAPAWLRAAAAFDLRASGPRLLDADGTVVARLAPGGRPTAGPDLLASLADPPTVTAADRRAFSDPAPVPSGLQPADRASLVGRWLPKPADDVQRPEQPMLELHADGTWTSSDGCNGTDGRWTTGDDGRVLATAGATTQAGCTNVNVAESFFASRAAFDGTVLVLLDANGTETGRLAKSG